MQTRFKELDYFRFFCMMAVIVIHVTSAYIFMETRLKWADINIAYFLNQAARFAVPGFIFLSGISLSFSKNTSFGVFYRKRFGKILLPYLFWNMVYYASNQGYDIQQIFENIPVFFKGLMTGGNASHLYFIIILLQLYLVYPFLLWLKQKAPVQLLLVSFFLTYILQQWIYQQTFQVFILPPFWVVYGWLLAPTWIFYFVLGMYITKERLFHILEWAHQHLCFIFLSVVAFLYYYVINSVQTKSYELSINPSLLIYVPLVFILVVGLVRMIDVRLSRVSCQIDRIVKMISDRSMVIYFSHVFFLSILKKKLPYIQGIRGMVWLLVSVFVLSLLFSQVVYLVKKTVGKLFSKG